MGKLATQALRSAFSASYRRTNASIGPVHLLYFFQLADTMRELTSTSGARGTMPYVSPSYPGRREQILVTEPRDANRHDRVGPDGRKHDAPSAARGPSMRGVRQSWSER